MIVAVVVLAWLLINTLATLIIICIDGGTPSSKAGDWIGTGISCVFSPLVMVFVVQPIYTWMGKLIRKRRKK